MVLEAEGSALVAGAALASATRHIKVLRPFFYKGMSLPPGTVLEVDRLFAAEMHSYRKAEIVSAPVVEPIVEIEQEATEADKPRRRKKESSDAE